MTTKATTKYIGVDLGGTHMRAAIVDTQDGAVSNLIQVATLSREGHDAVMTRMAALVDQVIQAAGETKDTIGGIGIGAPGLLDLDHGTVLFLPNLPGNWKNVPLQQRIRELVGLPVHLLNDARAMTFGEWMYGAGRGVDTVACYTLGTGVGGGLVIGGKLHLGISGSAGELGHASIDMNGPQCGCGNRGCVEVYASGPAIAAAGVKAVVQGLTTRIGEMAGYDLNKITPELVFRAARDGDLLARRIYEFAGECLGVAISNIIVSVTPRKIVIGGGVAQAGDLLLEPIRRTIRERVVMAPIGEIQVIPAELGTYAGMIGAAAWARHCERGG
ncbi:MAG: ROK family protein [Chloroflexota bacterium]